MNLTGSQEPERIDAGNVSASLFGVLGVVSELVGFPAGGGAGGLELVVILDHGLCQRRFGGSLRVIGTRLTLEGRPPRSSASCPYPPASPPNQSGCRARSISLMRGWLLNYFLMVPGRLEGRPRLNALNTRWTRSPRSCRTSRAADLGHGAHVIALLEQVPVDVRPSFRPFSWSPFEASC